MSFLSRLFGSGPKTEGARGVEAQFEKLEEEAKHAHPSFVGTSLNKAGDLAQRAGQEDRALAYYGRAIDAFLDDEQREAARGVANKLIRVRPSAVRTLCTLTWLDLAAGHTATALLHLRDYVAAAGEAGQQARAATQIYAMARLSADPEIVASIADSLDSLDYPTRGEEVRRWASDGAPGAIEDARELAESCLRAAIRSNDRDTELLRDADA